MIEKYEAKKSPFQKNEHTQQSYFAQRLVADNFMFNLKNIQYKLVCWELMCEKQPFRINRNKAYNGAKRYPWNASIDFILYSEEKNRFIFIEMKNYLKPLPVHALSLYKNILKAFLQATYSSIMFKKNYDKKELYMAMADCFLGAKDEEGGRLLRKKYKLHDPDKIKEHITLPEKNDFKIDRYIMPFRFKTKYEDVKKIVDELNDLNYSGLKEKINGFKTIEKITKKNDKEYYRFLNLLNPDEINHFIGNQNSLDIYEIKNNYKNFIDEYEGWIENITLIPELKNQFTGL